MVTSFTYVISHTHYLMYIFIQNIDAQIHVSHYSSVKTLISFKYLQHQRNTNIDLSSFSFHILNYPIAKFLNNSVLISPFFFSFVLFSQLKIAQWLVSQMKIYKYYLEMSTSCYVFEGQANRIALVFGIQKQFNKV